MTMTASRQAPAPPRHRGRHVDAARRVVHAVGELLVTLGVLVVLFVVWQLWGTGISTGQTQGELRSELARQWTHGGLSPTGAAGVAGVARPAAPATRAQQPGVLQPGVPAPAGQNPGEPTPTVSVPPKPDLTAPPEGNPLLRLRVPSIGLDWIVVQGVDLADLAKGPGHYPGTAMPGQVGNFAVAGHRTTHGAPFFRIGELRAGDVITAQVAGATYTYRVSSREIVDPSQVSVVAPVPDRPGVMPTERLLTLTSCNPKYSARQRMIVHARLVSSTAG